MKAIKFRIYPTLSQRRQLSKEFACRRIIWNWALNRKIEAYKENKTSLNYVLLSRELTQKKKEDEFLTKASSTALQNTLFDLDEAFKKFFRHENRFPKFKKFGAVNSTCYSLDKRTNIFRDGELLKLPKIGEIKTIWTKPILTTPNSDTISKTKDGRWFVSLQYNDTPPELPKSNKEVGIDLGLTCFAALSDGRKFMSPKPLRKAMRKLAHVQRDLSRKEKGSKNRAKSRQIVSRLHSRIADQRADYLHKLSTSIVSEHGLIAIEDLNVRGMMSRGKIARSIGDVGWSEFRRMLTYKSLWYGRTLSVVPRFQRTTGVCPDCGFISERLPLNVRSWICECGVEHDRDIAAAEIILQTVRSTGIACGERRQPNDSGANP